VRRLPSRAAVERAVGTLWRGVELWYRDDDGIVQVDPAWLKTPERRRQLWERVASWQDVRRRSN
jgi:hypothetical protein